MKITDIVPKSPGFYTIFLDDKPRAVFNEEIIVEAGLRVGNEVTIAELKELREAALLRKAKERALYLLGYRDYSRKELEEKLLKSYDEEITEKTLQRMEEFGFLNDEDLSRKYAVHMAENKLYPPSRIRFELAKRGFGQFLIEDVLYELEEQYDPVELACRLILRKYGYPPYDEKRKQQLFGGLARSGYRYGQIKEAVNRLSEEYPGDDPE
ncbi:MAG: regulatory protein RecX [Ruminococcaceae bacterium]|nr:regulatory protein RecX [Oscillospiraceae bacterium]